MDSMALDGSERDLEHFGRGILKQSFELELPSPFERRLAWNMRGNSGVVSSSLLRSGIALSAAAFRWEQAPPMAVEQAPGGLEFVLSRGPLMRVQCGEDEHYTLGGGTVVFGQVKRPVRMVCSWEEDPRNSPQEHLCVGIPRERLLDLLGASELPAALRRIEQGTGAYPRAAQRMALSLHRAFDEVLHCDARGTTRQLYLEAKGLELLALMIDQLDEHERDSSPQLSPQDIERLERSRRLLIERMTDPPSLPELARAVGLNEVKLKVGFRTLFGDTVFGYLRRHRMDEAHRLLRQRRFNVTEIAGRVGYENPSKFAAAFRKQFGFSPSSIP